MRLVLGGGFQPATHVAAQLIERRVFSAEPFGERVVEFRNFRGFVFVDFNGKDGFLAGKFRVGIIRRKLGFDESFFARAHPDDPTDETRNKAVLDQLDRLVFGFPALERDVVDAALVVERRNVADFNRTLDRHERCRFAPDSSTSAPRVKSCWAG